MYHEMQLGSRGPQVTILQAFLCGAGLGKDIEMEQCYYGAVTARAVAKLQHRLEITADGSCFGSTTRKAVKRKFGFDFDLACQALDQVVTEPEVAAGAYNI